MATPFSRTSLGPSPNLTSIKRTFDELGRDPDNVTNTQASGSDLSEGDADRHKRARSDSPSFSPEDLDEALFSSDTSSSTFSASPSSSEANIASGAVAAASDVEPGQLAPFSRLEANTGSHVNSAPSSPDSTEQYRISMERYNAFDNNISVLRRSLSPERRLSLSPPNAVELPEPWSMSSRYSLSPPEAPANTDVWPRRAIPRSQTSPFLENSSASMHSSSRGSGAASLSADPYEDWRSMLNENEGHLLPQIDVIFATPTSPTTSTLHESTDITHDIPRGDGSSSVHSLEDEEHANSLVHNHSVSGINVGSSSIRLSPLASRRNAVRDPLPSVTTVRHPPILNTSRAASEDILDDARVWELFTGMHETNGGSVTGERNRSLRSRHTTNLSGPHDTYAARIPRRIPDGEPPLSWPISTESPSSPAESTSSVWRRTPPSQRSALDEEFVRSLLLPPYPATLLHRRNSSSGSEADDVELFRRHIGISRTLAESPVDVVERASLRTGASPVPSFIDLRHPSRGDEGDVSSNDSASRDYPRVFQIPNGRSPGDTLPSAPSSDNSWRAQRLYSTRPAPSNTLMSENSAERRRNLAREEVFSRLPAPSSARSTEQRRASPYTEGAVEEIATFSESVTGSLPQYEQSNRQGDAPAWVSRGSSTTRNASSEVDDSRPAPLSTFSLPGQYNPAMPENPSNFSQPRSRVLGERLAPFFSFSLSGEDSPARRENPLNLSQTRTRLEELELHTSTGEAPSTFSQPQTSSQEIEDLRVSHGEAPPIADEGMGDTGIGAVPMPNRSRPFPDWRIERNSIPSSVNSDYSATGDVPRSGGIPARTAGLYASGHPTSRLASASELQLDNATLESRARRRSTALADLRTLRSLAENASASTPDRRSALTPTTRAEGDIATIAVPPPAPRLRNPPLPPSPFDSFNIDAFDRGPFRDSLARSIESNRRREMAAARVRRDSSATLYRRPSHPAPPTPPSYPRRRHALDAGLPLEPPPLELPPISFMLGFARNEQRANSTRGASVESARPPARSLYAYPTSREARALRDVMRDRDDLPSRTNEEHATPRASDVHRFISRRSRTAASRIADDVVEASNSEQVPALRADGANSLRQRRLISQYRWDRTTERRRTAGLWGDIDGEDGYSANRSLGPMFNSPEALQTWRRQSGTRGGFVYPPPRPPPNPSYRHVPLPTPPASTSPPDEREGERRTTAHLARMRTARQRSIDALGRLQWMSEIGFPPVPTGRHAGDYVRDDEFNASYESLLSLADFLGEVRPRGVSEDILSSLPRGQYQDWATPGETEERCPICLDDYQPTDLVLKLTSCSHWFHKPCLEQWLKGAGTCPVCRSRVNGPRGPRPRPELRRVGGQTNSPSTSGPSASESGPVGVDVFAEDDDEDDEAILNFMRGVREHRRHSRHRR